MMSLASAVRLLRRCLYCTCRYAVGQISDGSTMAYRPAAESHVIRLEPHMPGANQATAGAPSPDLHDKLARRAATKR